MYSASKYLKKKEELQMNKSTNTTINKSIDLSIAKNLFEEKERMCSTFENCSECVLDRCEVYANNLDAVTKVVQEWSDSHPKKTRLEDFLEKYPNMKANSDGFPLVCCSGLGYANVGACGSCSECWNETI